MKGHLRERSKGVWAIVIELERGPDGKRRQRWHTVHGTKREAERELSRLLHQVHTGSYVEPSQLTVAAYLKRWLEDDVCHRLKPRTYDRYELEVRLRLIPLLGHHRLDKLTPLHIQSCYSTVLAAGRQTDKSGLAAGSVRILHAVVRAALKQAVRWQLIAKSPADAVVAPRSRPQEMVAFSLQQVKAILDATRGKWLYMPVLLAITTGMRRNEILALRWRDIDLQAGRLSVRQSLEKSRSGLAFAEPKTQKGRRPIDLPQLLVRELRRHRAEQDRQRAVMGDAYRDHDLVVCWGTGNPALPGAITNRFAQIARDLKLPSTRFHDLRHTHATLLLRQGEHPKVVSERLGHANIGITLDRYSHVMPDMQAETAKRLDATLRETLGNAPFADGLQDAPHEPA